MQQGPLTAETHTGMVFLVGDRAYKVKKPVVTDFLDFSKLQGFLQDKIHYTLADLAQCGCENEPLGELLAERRERVLDVGRHHGEGGAGQ